MRGWALGVVLAGATLSSGCCSSDLSKACGSQFGEPVETTIWLWTSPWPTARESHDVYVVAVLRGHWDPQLITIAENGKVVRAEHGYSASVFRTLEPGKYVYEAKAGGMTAQTWVLVEAEPAMKEGRWRVH